MIIEVIMALISIIILNVFMHKSIEHVEGDLEKFLSYIYWFISDIFIIIFYMDRFNLPSLLNLNINVNTQNWLIIITTCISSVISAAIGGIIALKVSKDQIRENNKQNYDNNRIQNMPLIKFDCIESDNFISKEIVLKSKFEDGIIKTINLNIKNIGLNAVRKSYLRIESDILDKIYDFELLNQGIIEKDKEQTMQFIITLQTNRLYIFNIIFYYQDLLFNKYEQKVILEYDFSSINDGRENYKYNYNFLVKEEKQIEDFPKFKGIS